VDPTAVVDHSPWQQFLDRYLLAAEDGRTLVRYSDVTSEDRNQLATYIDMLATLDPDLLSYDERLAYWINLYNALTVKIVLDNPDKPGIRQMGSHSASTGPWDDVLLSIAGKPVTLNDIEHRILRPIFKDHRIHFAINCASTSCPNLAPEAYSAANVERLLQQGEQSYLHHPRGLVFAESGELHLSSIFAWYRADFAEDRAALLSYLANARPDIAERLREHAGDIRFAYDWTLNSGA